MTKSRGRLLAYLLVVGTACFLVVRGESTRNNDSRHNREAQTRTCQAINENRAALRNLLVSARNQTPKKMLTKRTRRFYRKQIRQIKPLDCGHFNRDSLARLRERKGDDASAGKPAKPP